MAVDIGENKPNLTAFAVGIGGILIAAAITFGASTLWGMNSQLATLSTQMQSMGQRIGSLETSLDNNIRSRYTAEAAATDRAAIMQLIAEIIERNRVQDESLRGLELWRASVNGRPTSATRPEG